MLPVRTSFVVGSLEGCIFTDDITVGGANGNNRRYSRVGGFAAFSIVLRVKEDKAIAGSHCKIKITLHYLNRPCAIHGVWSNVRMQGDCFTVVSMILVQDVRNSRREAINIRVACPIRYRCFGDEELIHGRSVIPSVHGSREAGNRTQIKTSCLIESHLCIRLKSNIIGLVASAYRKFAHIQIDESRIVLCTRECSGNSA